MTDTKKALTISLPASQLAMLDEIQTLIPISKSELIRQAVDAHLPELKKLSKALKRAGLENKQ